MLKLINHKKLVVFSLILVFVITTGLKCGGPPGGLIEGKPKSITLNYWKVWEGKSNIDPLISAYQQKNPHVKINYRNLTYEEFEYELLNALAVDRGPDIFSIHTTWMKDYLDKIQPLPSQITTSRMVIRGTIKEEAFTEKRTKNTLNLKDLRTLYPDVVYQNQYINNQIYGLPLSIDTMALYSNRDLLNNAGIVSPPKTWNDFQDQVVKITRQNPQGDILIAGAAIGTADNVNRSPDILSLLMLQNGAQMFDERGRIAFDDTPEGLSINPARQALNFYNSFASPAKQVYTWNSNMDNSLQEFMTGKVAFYFGYAYDLATIKAQSPQLNFEVSAMPQISEQTANRINHANYWVETVSNKSEHIDEAWDFILFMSTQAEQNKKYLDKANKPCALKSLIKEQSEDVELSAFVNQILTAQSWYKGNNPLQAEEIFKTMIKENLTGVAPTREIIRTAVLQLNRIY